LKMQLVAKIHKLKADCTVAGFYIIGCTIYYAGICSVHFPSNCTRVRRNKRCYEIPKPGNQTLLVLKHRGSEKNAETKSCTTT